MEVRYHSKESRSVPYSGDTGLSSGGENYVSSADR